MTKEMIDKLIDADKAITKIELIIGKYPGIDPEYINALIRCENALAFVLNNADKIKE